MDDKKWRISLMVHGWHDGGCQFKRPPSGSKCAIELRDGNIIILPQENVGLVDFGDFIRFSNHVKRWQEDVAWTEITNIVFDDPPKGSGCAGVLAFAVPALTYVVCYLRR
jgi:hypothetical protein